MDTAQRQGIISRVPEITIFFWIIKVLATTVGETAADYLNVGLGFGLYKTTAVMGSILIIALLFKLLQKRYVAPIYWLVIVLLSIAGTLGTDILTDGLSFPLVKSSALFLGLLAATFAIWKSAEGTISIHSVTSLPREVFYWLVVLFTFALGTAVGDLFAEKFSLGYLLATGVFVAVIAAIGLGYSVFKINEDFCFWAVFILTRPLGASFGDLLSQSRTDGGLGLGAMLTSLIFLIAIAVTVQFTKAERVESSSPN